MKYQVVCFYFDEFMGWANYVYKEVNMKCVAEELVSQLNYLQYTLDYECCTEYFIIREVC